jgi:hypothetical protein
MLEYVMFMAYVADTCGALEVFMIFSEKAAVTHTHTILFCERNMKVVSFAFLGVLALALSSCGAGIGSSVPTITTQPVGNHSTKTEVLGRVQISEDGTIQKLETIQKPSLSAQAAYPDNAVTMTKIDSYGYNDVSTNTRYSYSTFTVTNNTTEVLHNFGLYTFNQAPYGVGGTAFKSLKDASDQFITDPQAAQAIQAIQPLSFTTGTAQILTDKISYQGLTPTEAFQIDQGSRATVPPVLVDPKSRVLEWGYSIRNAAGSADLQPGETGYMTFAVKRPVSIKNFVWTGVFATLPQNRVTRAPGETTASAVARANAVGATELMLTGTDTDTAPTPLVGKRVKYPMIYTDQDVPEADIGPDGGYVKLGRAVVLVPKNSLTGTATVSIKQLASPPQTLPGGLQPNTQYEVSSGVAKPEKPFVFMIPFTKQTGAVNETFQWKDSKYTSIRLGTNNDTFVIFSKDFSTVNGNIFSNTYAVGSQAQTNLQTSCLSNGGTWNSIYCRPAPNPNPPAITSASQPTTLGSSKSVVFQSLSSNPKKYRVLSYQAGNADQFGCGARYTVKLCSFSFEKVASEEIANTNPDIIAVQEVWNDHCSFREPVYTPPSGTTGTQYTDMLLFLRDTFGIELPPMYIPLAPADEPFANFVCSSTIDNMPEQHQINRIVNSSEYDIRCTMAKQGSDGKWYDGYECIAIKKSLFEFTDLSGAPTVVDHFIKDVSSNDTGFQVETIKLKSSVGPYSRIYPNENANKFDVANAHLRAPPYIFDRESQLIQLENRYRNLNEKSIILGDFNTNPVQLLFLNDPGGRKMNELVSRKSTPVDSARATPPKLWYSIDDDEDTAFCCPIIGGTLFGWQRLDHVISNFADGNCSRSAAREGFDHLYTICNLTGFDSATAYSSVSAFDTSPNQIGKYPISTIPKVFRRGVRLDYAKWQAQGNGRKVYIPDGSPAYVFLDTLCPGILEQTALTFDLNPNEFYQNDILIFADSETCQ